MIALSVWLDQQHVGQLAHDAGSNRFSFAYAPDWLRHPLRYPLCPQLPLEPPPDPRLPDQHSAVVRQFFENLLPEGEALDHAALAAGTSKANLMGLLVALGKETAGAVRVTLPTTGDALPRGQEAMRLITPEELSQRIRKRQETPFSVWDGRVRLSIAGYQDKIAVYEKDGQAYLVEGPRLASTFIVKPLPTRPRMKTLPENEYLCTQLAGRVGLDVAPTRLAHVPESVLLVRRFDRLEANGRVARLHVIDGCQALGLPVSMKYERNYGDGPDVAAIRDGVSLQKLFAFARARSPRPAVDVRALLRWAVFQVLIGNTDAHGKNISFFSGVQGESLAPAYDIVCIAALGAEFSNRYAMAIGDAFSSAEVTPYEWAHFAHACQLPFRLVATEIESIAQRIVDAIEGVAADVRREGVPREVSQGIIDVVVPQCLRHREFAAQVRRFKAADFS